MDVKPIANLLRKSRRLWDESWTWEEIYLALCRERGSHQRFEIETGAVRHPLAAGAVASSCPSNGWDYMFPTSDGGGLFIVARDGRYSAFLGPERGAGAGAPAMEDPSVWRTRRSSVTWALRPRLVGMGALGIVLAGLSLLCLA